MLNNEIKLLCRSQRAWNCGRRITAGHYFRDSSVMCSSFFCDNFIIVLNSLWSRILDGRIKSAHMFLTPSLAYIHCKILPRENYGQWYCKVPAGFSYTYIYGKGCKNHKEELCMYVVGKSCNTYRLQGNPMIIIRFPPNRENLQTPCNSL